MTKHIIKPQSLFFAPMEGITDESYRDVILENYPEWNYVSTDFLRIPTVGSYPTKHILHHYGEMTYNTIGKKEKTIYQILTSEIARTQEHVELIRELGFTWLDLNLGCPSKTVCKNKGGSYLLSDLQALANIITTIRENFPHTFTTKIRVGYKDSEDFERIIKMLTDLGVDAITIHARTRDELYKGVANWNYVKRAVTYTNLPIIGNGDIWSVDDIHRYYDYTGCHSIMLARSALKTPWLAANYFQGIRNESEAQRAQKLIEYYQYFLDKLQFTDLDETARLRRLKSVSRYVFDDFAKAEELKSSFLRAKEVESALSILRNIQ